MAKMNKINAARISKLIESSLGYANTANDLYVDNKDISAQSAALISQAYSQAAMAELKFQEMMP